MVRVLLKFGVAVAVAALITAARAQDLTTIVVSWSEVYDDIDGNPINEPVEYKLYADIGFGYTEIVTTPDLLYIHETFLPAGTCFSVYLKACYVGSGICSPASEIEEGCLTEDGLGESQDPGQDGDGSGSGGSGNTIVLGPPKPPVFTIQVRPGG